MYKLKQGVSAARGEAFFIIEVNNKTYMWEVLDFDDEGETVAFWGEWPPEWMPLLPTRDSSRLAFLLHEGRDLEESIRTCGKPEFIAECGL